MTNRSYYRVLQKEMRQAENSPIKGDKTREQLEVEIARITAELKSPLDNAARIGLVADRQQLRRELAALGG